MVNSKRSADFALSIYHLFRKFQQRNSFVLQAHELPLSTTEANLLVELDSDPTISIGTLSNMLRMDSSSISRMLQALARRKLVKVSHSKVDARCVQYRVTAAGSSLLRRFDESANSRYRQFAASMSAGQIIELKEFLKVLSDGLGAMDSPLRPVDFLLRGEIRRVTRALGLLSANFQGFGISAVQWQVLTEISTNPLPQMVNSLIDSINIPQNTMSQLLTSLEKRKLLMRQSVPHDKRARRIILTTQGERLVSEIESAACLRIEQALSGLTSERLKRGIGVLELFVGTQNGSGSSSRLSQTHTVRALLDPELQADARALSIRYLVERKLERFVPPQLISAETKSFGLYEKEKLVAVISYRAEDKSALATLDLFVCPRPDLEKLCQGFIQKALSGTPSVKRVRIPPHLLESSLFAAAKGKKDKASTVSLKRLFEHNARD